MKGDDWSLQEWTARAPPDGVRRELEHRVAALARQENIEVMILGHAGIKLKVIADYTGLSINQINYRLKLMGIRINDYREGKGVVAEMVFNRLTAAIAARGIQRIREKTDR